MNLSLYMLPPAERRLVEILLLLPIAALIICIFRNVIGLNSFGTFAPALIGLAFHDLHSLPGILVFVTILLIGWLMRRVLDHYHLLQVPRVATMLTLIMIVLISAVVAANLYGAPTTRYISLFPHDYPVRHGRTLLDAGDRRQHLASFRTLFQTMLIATVIALVLSRSEIVQHMFRYPETLGLIMAAAAAHRPLHGLPAHGTVPLPRFPEAADAGCPSLGHRQRSTKCKWITRDSQG